MFGSAWILGWLSFSLPFVQFVGREWLMTYRLSRDGFHTTGEVLALEREVYETDGGKGVTYSIRYTFRAGPGGGERYEAEHRIDRRAYRSLSVGGPVNVSYWRPHPSWSRAEGASWRGMQLVILSGIVASIASFGPLLVLRSIRDCLDERRLYREGLVVHGVVLRADRKSDFEGNITLKLRYRLEPEGAASIEGKTTARFGSSFDGELPRPGTRLVALWAPPKKHRVL